MQVTDSASEAASIFRVLKSFVGHLHSEHVADANQLQAALAKGGWHVVIAHLRAEPLNPAKVLAILQQTAPALPCIVVADQLAKDAVELMKAGACDFVLTEDFSRLGAAVDAALQIPQQHAAPQHAEKALRENDENFFRYFDISPDSINLTRVADGVNLDVNQGFTKIMGYTREEALGHSTLPGDLNIWINRNDRDRVVAELKARGEVTSVEAPFRSKNGQVHIGLFSARRIEINGEDCILSITRDITERKQAESEREATIRLLRFCNQHDDMQRLLRKLTLFFQEVTGCEAIGVRLREGADFPYYETRGFPPEFVQAESHLCLRDEAGEAKRDAAGNPILACMCGHVLRNQLTLAKPNLTKKGSFWTNSASSFLAATPEFACEPHARGRCMRDGYESIAIIPLHGRNESIGLLQFNDRRPGLFTAARIAFFEELAEHVATALLRLDTERALRSSEEHLRAVLNTSEAGYFFIDQTGRFQNVNPAWLRLHGYERAEEIIGQHFRVTQVEAEIEKTNAFMTGLLTGQKLPVREFSRRRKDGSVGYHNVSAHVVREEGRILGIEGFLIDTTGLRQVQHEYQTLFEQMLDGFALHEMIFDPAGKPVDYRFLAVNPAFEKMTGLKASEIIGKRLLEILPETETKWIENYGAVVSTGTPKRFDDFAALLGKHFEVLAFRPQAGQFACLIQDITDRKQLELQLLQSQKMEAIGQLAGGVAHDFNNILAATMMHLNLLQRVPELTLSMKDSLRELEAENKRAIGLTRQLLLFSRRQAMQVNTLDLNELLANLLKMLQRLIGEHIELTFNRSEAPLWIEADAGMIEQVILNLCVNSRDAMPHEGRLIIDALTTNLDSTKDCGDSESRSGEFIRLSVRDTGCGMNETTLVHIFEPFFTTKGVGKGTGLGLATVYSIVKQHHGWVNVLSTVGTGTTFHIYLPAATTPRKTANYGHEGSALKGGTEGILVVEDDAHFRTMMAMTLRVLGYRVFEAANGQAALTVWQKHATEIEVVCTDQVMPGGISGLDLCKTLHEAKPTLRTIICTGYSQCQIDPEQLLAHGIDFLPKPFSSEVLAHALRRCIDRTDRIKSNA